MNCRRPSSWVLCVVLSAIILLACGCGNATVPTVDADCDLVILSTTDMHGKCWERNVLNDRSEPHNMLRVCTAVKEVRNEYGKENVILVDNGDLFQGTPVSEVHLLDDTHAQGEPEAMALCLAEIGYDAFVLGNHEFDYPFEKMRAAYDYLWEKGIDVLAANAYWDGSDGTHEAADNAFGTYIVREVTVMGHPHKVGIVGFDNTDISRWDLPQNYPGIVFAHPDNPDYDMAKEVNRYLSEMRDDGCEMIVVTYHSGLGTDEGTPAFGVNTDHQGMRVIDNTDCIDLLILGHDHSSAYSNSSFTDAAEREVPVVNGGSQDLTKTVFNLSEDADGKLVCELESTENVDLTSFEPDADLEEKIRPYAEGAIAKLEEPIGRLSGTWDALGDFYNQQTDTMDLILQAMIDGGTRQGASGSEEAAQMGLDHTDVDVAITGATENDYIAHAGDVSIRDIYRMCEFPNDNLVIPMSGRELKDVMEENATTRMAARVLNGRPYYLTKGDAYTHLIFGGINFRYDMSKPEGERVLIESLSNGRAFDLDNTYLVAVNSFILGNEGCALRKWSNGDALWREGALDQDVTVQEAMQTYIAERSQGSGGVTPDMFAWKWSNVWSKDLSLQTSYEGPYAAVLADAPEDGHAYVLFNEAEGRALARGDLGDGAVAAKEVGVCGNYVTGTLADDVRVFTAHVVGDDTLMLSDQDGRYLTRSPDGELKLTEEPAEDDGSIWFLGAGEPGYYVQSVGSKDGLAIECYKGRFDLYRLKERNRFLLNFYEVDGS